jgi:transposase-like protein
MKQRITFSEAFKREKVELIEKGTMKVSDLVALYNVNRSSVYKWMRKYGLPATECVVVQKHSEAVKNVELLKQVSSLERIIGQMQVEKLYLENVIATGSDLLGEDLKKKFNSQPLKKPSSK